jgi:hypothetical protein
MAKKFDPKAKAKRQKIMVAVGGVLLLGLLAFQVPRTMKMLHQQGADDSAAAATTTTSAATTPAASSAAASAATPASATGAGDGLGDPDVAPAPQSGQLLAFSRFRTKDPFAQQLDLTCGSAASSDGSTSASCGSGSSTSTSSSASNKGKAPATPPSGGGNVTPVSNGGPPPAPTVTRPTTAKISVNGIAESVRVGADFPASSPTFTLVSLTRTSAKIGITGGSLESGSATVTLTKNKPLTLMNTADGTRYVLRLVSVS